MRSISARPANEDDTLTAAGYTIWDLQFGRIFQLPPDWTSGFLKTVALEIDIQNLFNQNYREAQFATDSRLQDEPEIVSDVNYVPGYPITVIGGIRVEF
jgi:outer membrane receptor protein involved in Fe transport